MDKKKCNSCGEAPHKCSCKNKEFTKAVIEIDNPEQITLMRRVVIPASMGDDTTVPPTIGKYHNVLLYYEANQKSYLYSSDGIPTQLVNGLTNYEEAINLPQINGVTLLGDKSAADLKLADAPMVITVASGNTSWSGAATAKDVYDFFLNKGKVNIIFNGEENYSYEIASAAYIPGEEKMMCTLAVASIVAGETAEFEGNALFGIMTLYTAHKAIDVSQIELQPKLYIADFTGLELNYNELSGLPATTYSIGMVKPGDGLEVASDGTLSISDIEQYAHFFDTVADMKAATNLVAGDYARTGGFYTVNDGGGALYKITSTGTANEMDVIAVGALFAHLIAPVVVTPEIYGAYGDGIHNDTAAIQKALDDASSLKRKIELDKNYIVSQIVIKDGIPEVTGVGTVKGNGTVNTGIVFLGTNDTPLKNCTISLNVDMSAGEYIGINGYSTENCLFTHCNIYGGTIKANNTYYLRIVESIKNRFVKNNITAPTSPTGGNHYLLIFSVENPQYLYGGIFDAGHTIHYEAKSNVDNIIAENSFIGGTHAIVLGWSLRNTVENNIFKFQSHRGVAIQNACSYNKVCNNQFEGILSSGILMTYGCSYNDIIGNTFVDNLEISPSAVGQGVICGYIHVMYNHIADNIIDSGRLYGIQLSADVVGNVVENNTIGNYYLTGIYLNSDLVPTGYVWSDDFPIPADAIFTRTLTEHTPFTDSEGTPQDYVAFYDCEKNIIQNNTIHRSIINNSTAAIYVTQIGNRVKLQYNVIQDNTYDGVQSGKYYVYLYEQTTNYCIHNSLINNLVNGSEKQIAKFWFSAWRKHFDNLYENDVLDKGMVTVTGTTISAKYNSYYKIANSEAKTLTSITDTVEGNEILLRLDAYTTIQHASGGNLRLKGGTNVAPQNNNAFIKFIDVGGALVEIFRSF